MTLVNCTVYRNGTPVARPDPSEVGDYLSQKDTFVWLALSDPWEQELQVMAAEFGLHPLAVEDANHGQQRPKLEQYGDSLFVVMHTLELTGDEALVGEVALFVGPNYLLSVRKGVHQGFARARQRAERDRELLAHGPTFALYSLMDEVVDRYFPALDLIEHELDDVEARIFSGGRFGFAIVQDIFEVKQKLMLLKHATSPLLEAVTQLLTGRPRPIPAEITLYFRDIYDHLLRIDQAIDADRDAVSTALSANLSLTQLQDSITMRRLASYAALIGVPTMIVGIYGMNFTHMPELDWLVGYPLAVGFMGAVDAYLFYRLRQSGWL